MDITSSRHPQGALSSHDSTPECDGRMAGTLEDSPLSISLNGEFFGHMGGWLYVGKPLLVLFRRLIPFIRRSKDFFLQLPLENMDALYGEAGLEELSRFAPDLEL
jgi:hypothetical protein